VPIDERTFRPVRAAWANDGTLTVVDSSRDGSRGVIEVGGPSGIRIHGGDVQVGGAPQIAEIAPLPPMRVFSVDLTRSSALVARHPSALAAALSVGAGTILLGASVVISALQLPWVLLAAPAMLCAALLTAVLLVALLSHRRITTGGVDPDVEQRILDVAMSYGGRITVTAVAHALAMPMAEADAALSALARSGHVGIENDSASGVVVYVFSDIEAGLLTRRRLP
jgi:hypothetical protein